MNFNFINGRGQGPGRSNRTIVTAQSFFDSEGNVGYMKKTTFKALVEQLKDSAPGLLRQYRNLFDSVKDGMTIANPIHKQTHLTNQSDYYYLLFRKGMQRYEVTAYEVESMGKFIKDYASGIIETNFSIEDLIEECNK